MISRRTIANLPWTAANTAYGRRETTTEPRVGYGAGCLPGGDVSPHCSLADFNAKRHAGRAAANFSAWESWCVEQLVITLLIATSYSSTRCKAEANSPKVRHHPIGKRATPIVVLRFGVKECVPLSLRLPSGPM